MSGATGKVSQLEKVMSLLATLIEELKALPSEGTARMCSDLTPGLSTVMGSIARADPPEAEDRSVLQLNAGSITAKVQGSPSSCSQQRQRGHGH